MALEAAFPALRDFRSLEVSSSTASGSPLPAGRPVGLAPLVFAWNDVPVHTSHLGSGGDSMEATPCSTNESPASTRLAPRSHATARGSCALRGPPSLRPGPHESPRFARTSPRSPIYPDPLAGEVDGPSGTSSPLPTMPTMPVVNNPSQQLQQSTQSCSTTSAVARAAPPATSAIHAAPPGPQALPHQNARPWMQYAACSIPGADSARTPKTNQDRFFVSVRLGGLPNVHLFGVCDGHGEFGHLAAQMVADSLPLAVADELCGEHAPDLHALARVADGTASALASADSIEADPTHPAPPARARSRSSSSGDVPSLPLAHFRFIVYAVRRAIEKVELRMFADEQGRFEHSGTTLVCCLFIGSHVITINVGDSGAVLAQRHSVQANEVAPTHVRAGAGAGLSSVHTPDTPHTWPASAPSSEGMRVLPLLLSHPHKPGTPEERARVERLGGIVARTERVSSSGLSYLTGPLRVWRVPAHATSDLKVMGLSMARSIGDHYLSHVGVLSHPSAMYHQLQEGRDCVIVLASDGVWDVLPTEEVTSLVVAHSSAATAAKALAKTASRAWGAGGFSARRDDVTVVLIRCWSELWSR